MVLNISMQITMIRISAESKILSQGKCEYIKHNLIFLLRVSLL